MILHDRTQAAPLLLTGSVGVLPTDTVYGLAAVATNKTAVAQLYALKHRDHKPGTLIAANIDQLLALGIDKTALQRVAHLWPNPLSIIIPAPEELAYLHLGLDSLAIRIPADEPLRQLLETTGVLVTSSANTPGNPTAATLAEAQAYFGDTVSFYVDGGDLSDRQASTVARITDDGVAVLRQGAAIVPAVGATQQ